MDDIPSELISRVVERTMKALTALCQKIWEQNKWLTGWNKSLVMALPKEGKPLAMPRLQDHKLDQPPKLGDASFGAGQSIFNCRVMIAKHLEHQCTLYHNFIDFKKAFDRVCHDDL